eukprot:GHVQ01037958.1.p1 GENE.GHVQ01037958.1~~GHVQ01037958.1.p1  ORF type:complete len:375 (+),score=70.69 GHVQ01037958.1:177-1301(+)
MDLIHSYLRDSNCNLSLLSPGTDLAYAYHHSPLSYSSTSCTSHRHHSHHTSVSSHFIQPLAAAATTASAAGYAGGVREWQGVGLASDAAEPVRGAAVPSLKIPPSPFEYEVFNGTNSWLGCRVPHAPVYASLPSMPHTVFRLSIVDLPFLHSPPCAYCVVVFDSQLVRETVLAITRWCNNHGSTLSNANPSTKSAVTPHSPTIQSTFSASALPAFVVLWNQIQGTADRNTEKHPSGEGNIQTAGKVMTVAETDRGYTTIDKHLFYLREADLMKLGSVGSCNREPNSPEIVEETDSHGGGCVDVRCVWSVPAVREGFLRHFASSEREPLAVVLRPDGHILDLVVRQADSLLEGHVRTQQQSLEDLVLRCLSKVPF